MIYDFYAETLRCAFTLAFLFKLCSITNYYTTVDNLYRIPSENSHRRVSTLKYLKSTILIKTQSKFKQNRFIPIDCHHFYDRYIQNFIFI